MRQIRYSDEDQLHGLGEETQNAILLELARAETAEIGLSEFAQRLRIDASNLGKVMDVKRKLSRQLAARLEGYFESR
jgi:plasmid maintenance system antidote protein VapI